MRDKIMNAVLVVVTLVWALNFAADVFVSEYKPAPEINAIFMGIVGAIFAASGREAGSRDDRSGDRRNREEEPETPTGERQ
ncbi:hypothetical protein GCM10010423_65060 [Streptomyces levis]|uniref:Integral membrane protein n=1 Tax=Streptomyces levis TaxID=285566 RepID=A0ABN3P0Z2_9ACTN